MQDRARVVIIGAGIVGSSVAYHLAKLGWRDIVVLDQGPLFETGGSTSHAPGLVFQTNPSRTMCQLSQHTVKLYRELELDGQPCFHPVGSFEVAITPERWEDIKRRVGYARAWGLEGHIIGPAEARAQLPLLNPDLIYGAYAVPSDGLAKAVRACEAMAREVQALGAGTFYANTSVTGIDIANGRVQAVVTPTGRIAAETVLICAGIWGPRVGRMAGISIPLTPVEHQYARTTPLAELADETREIVHPILRHQDRAMYFRQHWDSYGVGSYQHAPRLVEADAIRPHSESASPASLPFTPEDFRQPWADACALLPALSQTEMTQPFNGMFSFTPDGLPLLGETPQVRGLWVAEAIWITHGGGVGKAVAEWMVTGTPELDLRECNITRFEAFAQTPAYVRARGAQQYREVYDVIHPQQPLEHPRPLRVSPFYPRQQALGAVFFEGRGWERPQWYTSNDRLLTGDDGPLREGWAGRFWSPAAAAEHHATRQRVALYDMTPLTRVEVSGPNALAFLQHLTTNQLDKPVGSVVYTLMCDERGGIKSDVTVTRLAEDRFQIACNGPLDLAYLQLAALHQSDLTIRETTGGTCGIGVWGPCARDLVQSVSEDDFSNTAFPYFTARQVIVGEVPALAQRVSYVGELGWEIYTATEYGLRLWDVLWEAGQPLGVVAGGRAAFDALRLEKGYRLWGADMHSEFNPYEAGLGFTVKLDKGDFVGREALARLKATPLTRKLCCLTLDDPMPVVMGKEPILADGRIVGYVTSAAHGYTGRHSIAYGYLPIEYANPGTQVEIEYFTERLPATVTPEPLYDPKGTRIRG